MPLQEHAELGKVRVDDKNNIIVFPEFDIDQQDSNLSISLRIDKTEQRQAKKMLRMKIQRHFISQGKLLLKISLINSKVTSGKMLPLATAR